MSPGDLVVCVNAGVISGASNHKDRLRLIEGGVYEIDQISPFPDPAGDHGVKVTSLDCWWWFHSKRFRPCRKTDIESLTAPLKERECEDACHA
jgi:hypothetical protein